MLRKNQKVDLIAGVPLFAGCSKKQLGEIAALADEVDFLEGATLIREGHRGREFVVVVEGSVRVTRNGRKVKDLGAGAFVGEMALVSDAPRNATVTTTSPVRLLVITDRAFKRLMEQSSDITFKVLDAVAQRAAENTAHDAAG